MSVDVLFRVFMMLAGTTMVVLFLRRASASTRHTVWVAGLIGSLALPLGALILPRLDLPVLTESKPNSEGAPPAVGLGPSSVAILDSSPETAPVDAGVTVGDRGEAGNHHTSVVPTVRPSMLMLIWCAGLLATIVRAGVGFRHIAWLRARSRPVENANWRQILASQRRALGSTAALDLRIGGDGIPPMTWGIFRHTILLPSEAFEWDSDRIRLVIAHELSHVKRRDGLVQLLTHLACAMHWFNPLAWYAAYRLRIERERACDDQVLNLGENPEDYADHLLAIARSINSRPALAALSMAEPHHLEARLRAILETTRNRRRLSTVSTRVVCCSGLLVSMILACAHLTVFTMPAPPQQLVASFASPEPLKSVPVQVPAPRPQASAPVGGVRFEAAGQNDLGLPIVREQVSPLLWVNATVSIADRRFVTGLKKQDFQIWEDKAEQSIESFSETADPISMGIVMDVSGSMKDVVSTARNAAVSFVKSGDPQDEYFLVSFTSSVSLEQDFTRDTTVIENALPSRSPGGGTTFFDATYLSLEKVNQGSNPKRVLLIFLGGDDNQSRYTFANLRDFASRQNVQIFAIGMKLSTEGKANLEELTGLHGGKAYFPESVSEINDLVTKVRVELKSQYMLGYRSTNHNRDGLWRKIAVKVSPPVGLPPMTVRATNGYFAP